MKALGTAVDSEVGYDDVVRGFREAFLLWAGQMLQLNDIDSYRKYQTDAAFKSGVDSLAQVAVTAHYALAEGKEPRQAIQDGEERAKTWQEFVDDGSAWSSFMEGFKGPKV